MRQKGAYDTLNFMGLSRWQRELRGSVRDLPGLVEAVRLDGAALPLSPAAAGRFPVRVPPAFLSRIYKGVPEDPLLRQVLPVTAEEAAIAGYGDDPIGEQTAVRTPGVIHKYHGRALLIATSACAVHCRYCFRSRFPYADNVAGRQDWRQALEYLQNDTSLTEVILSGGDPLMLPDPVLGRLFARLDRIAHLRRLRIHSRMPVAVPSRLDRKLLDLLLHSRLKPVLVMHANHPAEIDTAAIDRLRDYSRRGIVLLNQSVLLDGVNDNAAILAELSEKLFDCGVLPYYLHLLDRVSGSAHFEVEEERARAIMTDLRRILPGYLVPRPVRDEPGAPYKIPLL
jgi:EF-P beta-lysylation protein EpmB